MSDILVEIVNQGFTTITIVKTSTSGTLATINQGDPSKTFKLYDDLEVDIQVFLVSNTVTVKLNGVEDEAPIYVHGQESKDLDYGTPLLIKPSTSTRLMLRPTSIAGEGVKCGEVIIQPPLAS